MEKEITVRNVTKSVVKRGEVGKTPIPHVDLLSYSFHLGRYVLTSHSEISCRHRFEAKFPYSFPLLEKFQFCSTLRWLDIKLSINKSKFTACTQLPLLRFVAWLNLLQNDLPCQGKPVFSFFSFGNFPLHCFVSVVFQLQLFQVKIE